METRSFLNYSKYDIDAEYHICYNKIESRGNIQMYDVIFYRDSKGHEPIAEFIRMLHKKSPTDKNARNET